MTDTTDRLERLAKLRAEGSLSDIEYHAAKARILNEPASTSGSATPSTPLDENSLSSVWRERFALIDQHGMPNGKPYTEAVRTVDIWHRGRLLISMLAFILGPLYFLYLGLWRAALSLMGFSIVYAIVVEWLQLPDALDRVSFVIPSMAFAWTAIPLYYLRVRRGINDWNPLIWLRAEPALRLDANERSGATPPIRE